MSSYIGSTALDNGHAIKRDSSSTKNVKELENFINYQHLEPSPGSNIQKSDMQTNSGQISKVTDGGWGWVVVAASFFIAFIIDGVGGTFGLIFPYILHKFNDSVFLTSFAGSLLASFSITGPLAAELMKRFGYRPVAMVGGLLSCLFFIASIFTTNIFLFILTFGLLAGCCIGLVYLPSVVIVNAYFHTKRGLANGIVCSGSGAGLLVLAPFVNFLLENYKFEGAVLIISGILLQMCLFSSLFIDPCDTLASTSTFESENETSCEEIKALDNISSEEINFSNSFKNGIPSLEIINSADSNTKLPTSVVISNSVPKNCDHHLSPVCNDSISRSHTSLNSKPYIQERKHSLNIRQFQPLIVDSPHYKSDSHFQTKLKDNSSSYASVCKNSTDSFNPKSNKYNKGILSKSKTSFEGSDLFLTGSIATLHQLQLKHVLQTIDHGSTALQNNTVKSVNSTNFSIPDSAFEGSDINSCIVVEKQLGTNINSKQSGTRQLLLQPVFHVFCFATAMIQFGFPVAFTFLAEYATENGLSTDQCSILMSLMGSFNIVGRLSGGCSVNLKCGFDPLLVTNVSLLAAGVICLLTPLYTEMWSLSLFAALYGFFIGFFCPLQPLILVEYFGMPSLASAFGFLCMVKGVATIVGVPLAGFIFDISGKYYMCFIFAGSVFIASAVIHSLMPLTLSCQKHFKIKK